MPRPTESLAPVSSLPDSPSGLVRDCSYVLGYYGFIHTGLRLSSGMTVRHSAVLLVSADYTPFEVTLRGGKTVNAQALVVPPLVARTLSADGVPLLSFNIFPSHRAFHIFCAMHHPGVVALDRHAFNQLDDVLDAMVKGDASFKQAEKVFELAVAEATRQLPPALAPDPKALDLIRLLDENPKLSLDELARLFGRSNAAMSRMFSQAVGMSLRDYQSWLRQRRMYHLLYTHRSLTDVAHDAGYADSPQFSRTFSRWYGKSPSFSRDPRFVRVFMRDDDGAPDQDAG
ncbi:MAG: helix-turn-helix transcriptional regulator [Rhizobacter sp.]|nr:helix-turn-helix transcriptional regulator [Rhizobacter sp.]